MPQSREFKENRAQAESSSPTGMRNKRLGLGTLRAAGNSGKAYQKGRGFRRDPPKFACKFISICLSHSRNICVQLMKARDPVKRHNKKSEKLSRFNTSYTVLGRRS